MLEPGPAQRVTIFVSENHRYHGRSAHEAVFEFLFYHHIAGATVTRAVAGFGAHHQIHTGEILAASASLPVKIEFIEAPAKVSEVLPKIRDMIGDGIIAMQPTEVYFSGRARAPAAPMAPRHDRLEGRGKLMRIYVREKDRWHGKPLHEALVESLRAHDIAGVTVYRGIAGFGAERGGTEHEVPMMLSVVDTEERIQAYLPLLEEMLPHGLVALSDVEVIKYAHGGPGQEPRA
ncbi:MAG: DUF190 domain-containing protein [Terriglobales bacterium]